MAKKLKMGRSLGARVSNLFFFSWFRSRIGLALNPSTISGCRGDPALSVGGRRRLWNRLVIIGAGRDASSLGPGGAPEPPQSRDVGDPITISDGSGGDLLSKDAHTTDKEVEASLAGKRMSWPIGLHSIEERRKKEEEGYK